MRRSCAYTASRSRFNASSRADISPSVTSAGHPYAASTAASSRACASRSQVGRSAHDRARGMPITGTTKRGNCARLTTLETYSRQ